MIQSQHLENYLKELSIEKPTDIQNLSFPALADGRSVFALAPTGSGKTLAFVLPLLLKIQLSERKTQLLILVPTRELGTQIAQVCEQVGKAIQTLQGQNILVRTAFGGTPISKHLEELKKKPHVLIATPGRMIDILSKDVFDTKSLSMLVLDEADILVGMGFSEQLEEICEKLPKNLQVAMFSATKNEKVTSLEDFLFEGKKHLVLNAKKNLEGDSTDKLSDSKIKHQYLIVSSENKYDKLKQLLSQFEAQKSGKVILFCHQRETVHELAATLKKDGFLADALSGELGQVHRNSIMRNFKTGLLKYLVATNIASRGIDVDKIAAVIHFDVPFQGEDYIHRSGRTGRSGFDEGLAITLCESRRKTHYIKLMEDLHIQPEILSLKTTNTEVLKKDIPSRINFLKFHLNKGKQDKIRPGDILGAFLQELSLQKEDIGNIFIFNNFTHVEVNSLKKNVVLNSNFKIKNKVVKISMAQ